MRVTRTFTLIEILTVLAIITILAGAIFASFSGVRVRADQMKTKALIEQLKLAIEAYQLDFGDYPASDPKRCGIKGNGVNDGIECLVRSLSTTRKKGDYFQFEEGLLRNLDLDTSDLDGTSSQIKSKELFECVDAFDNPLIYLHNRDYIRGHTITARNIEGLEARILIKGAMSTKTNQYHSLNSFQLRSLGQNGLDDGGDDDDDIGSWK